MQHMPPLLSSIMLLTIASMQLGCGDNSTPQGREFSILADQIPGGAFLSIASDGDQAIFVGGQLDGGKGVIGHYQNGEFCVEQNATERALWWIHSARPGEWYAVGEAGTIIHSVHEKRTIESVDTNAVLYGVWDSGDRVIAVGGDVRGTKTGEVWVRDSGVWSKLASDLPGVTFKVWDHWIVGKEVAYYIDGDTLTPRFPPGKTSLLTVVGRNKEDVWAVGGTSSPTILHWENEDWKPIEIDPVCSNQGLNGVWTMPGEALWIAGFFGSMGAFDGKSWNCPKASPTYEHFHAVAKHKNEILWAGGNMFDQGNNYGTIGRFSTETAPITVTTCP